MCATLDREFSRLQELYTTADDPTLSRDAWTLLVEAADNWTEFVHAKGKLVADARCLGSSVRCCAAVKPGHWLGQRGFGRHGHTRLVVSAAGYRTRKH
jgi:hypothetical protein